MATRIYVKRKDGIRGPVSEQRLRELHAKGELTDTDLFRIGDESDWLPWSDVLSGTKRRSISRVRQAEQSEHGGYCRCQPSTRKALRLRRDQPQQHLPVCRHNARRPTSPSRRHRSEGRSRSSGKACEVSLPNDE